MTHSSYIHIGHHEEQKALSQIVELAEEDFVVLCSRWRNGRSFLMNTFFKDRYAFKLIGLEKNSKRERLANVATVLNRYGNGREFTRQNAPSDKSFWQYQIVIQRHDTQTRLTFEQLCLNYHRQNEQTLGIKGIITKLYFWNSPSDTAEKAQIDYIIKRADKGVNVCEMKFYDEDYQIKKKDDDVIGRLRAFSNAEKTGWRNTQCWSSHSALREIHDYTHNTSN